jgi:DNA replication initiation complex subunit (GINS family)
MEVISFEYLRKILNEEKKSQNLTKIPDDFYETVRMYIEGKKKLAKEKKDEIELRNIERIVENIFNLRERKIINFAIMAARAGVQPSNLTSEERQFFQKVFETLKERRIILDKIKSALEGEVKKKVEILVVFKQDFPAFVGIDGQTYGPFKKGDIAKLPEENRKILASKGIIEEFAVDSSST